MNTIQTTLTTTAVFSDDGTKRYLLTKTWDEIRKKLVIIMLCPSEASGISLDNTTMLVLNNADRLGYGSVTILNLFAELNDFGLRYTEPDDEENLKAIVSAAETADEVIYAPGVGKSKNKRFIERQRQVLEALRPAEQKLFCLCNRDSGARLQHPLSPAVRYWELSPLKIEELIEVKTVEEPEQMPKKRGRKAKSEGTVA